MNEKISFPDLVGLLSSKMNITKKEAETFLKEFFTVSTEVITSGEELRINGLGLFKPIWVEARAAKARLIDARGEAPNDIISFSSPKP